MTRAPRLHALAAGLALALPVAASAADAEVVFRDVSEQAGITFEQRSAPEKKYILESMSGGVALLDFDGDGRLDIYFVNALTVDTADQPRSAPSALYRNLGNGKFEDVAEQAGVAYPGWGMGACVADVDGDGDQDLYVTGVERNHFYRSRGNGTFEDASEETGLTAGGWSAGCAFADYDRDGDLDLFVSRYVRMGLEALPVFGKDKTCQYRGIPVQCGPRGLPGTGDLLFRNDDGRFTEVAKAAGVSDPAGYYGLGLAWLDVNDDGWLDLYVANDSNPNFLYLNRRDGTFEESAFLYGVAVSEDGGEQGGMGVAVGDPGNDGRLDLFVTNFSEEYNALYRHDGDFFSDVSFRSRSAPSSLPFVGWGTAFFDYDNDGWQDLVVVNGHVYPQLANAKLGASAAYRQRKLLYRNRGDGTFEEIGEQAGPGFTAGRVNRGLVVGDFNDDGRLDLLATDLDGTPQLLENQTPGTGNWIRIILEGKGKNPQAIGARLVAKIGNQTQTRLLRSGTGYLSQSDQRQHFGLGQAKKIDQLEIHWPDGTTSQHKNLPANQQIEIKQPQ